VQLHDRIKARDSLETGDRLFKQSRKRHLATCLLRRAPNLKLNLIVHLLSPVDLRTDSHEFVRHGNFFKKKDHEFEIKRVSSGFQPLKDDFAVHMRPPYTGVSQISRKEKPEARAQQQRKTT